MDFCLTLDLNNGKVSGYQGCNRGATTRSLMENGTIAGLVIGYSDVPDCELARWRHGTAAQISARARTADGNFVCVFWSGKSLRIVTDSSGSIPLYYAFNGVKVVLGTTANAVALNAGGKPLDAVSVADFIQNGAVCHPFSLYEGVHVCPPGAIAVLDTQGMTYSHYWLPQEADENGELADYASALKQQTSDWLVTSLSGATKVTVMFSGGEDSRALINLLPLGPDYRLKTIVDGVNREFRLAQRAAGKLGYPVDLVLRPPGHYSQQLVEKVLWAGAGLDVRHYHVFNSTAALLEDAGGLVGGLGSDKLFKSLFMGNVRHKHKTGFMAETLLSQHALVPTNTALPADLYWLNSTIKQRVWQRRSAHHEKLLTFRPKTAGNWHTLWPLGGHSPGHSQFLNNIRFGPRLVEPFMASANYRLAARVPEKYKVDRKLFNAAFLPVMGPASQVPTTSGRVPAVTGGAGRALQFCIKSWRVLVDETLKKLHRGQYLSQGPWSSEHQYFQVTTAMDVLGKDRALALDELIGKIAADGCTELFWHSNDSRAQQRKVLALQVGALFPSTAEGITAQESGQVQPYNQGYLAGCYYPRKELNER